MPLVDADYLDLRVGQRAATFRFDVLDANLNYLRSIYPDLGQMPTVDNNINRSVKRTLSDLLLAAHVDAGTLNAYTERVRPMMVLPTGSAYPLGVFLIATDDAVRQSWGIEPTVTGVDQCALVETPTTKTTIVEAGASIRVAIERQLRAALVPKFVVEDAVSGTVGSTLVWPGGQTTLLQIVNDLAALAGAYSLYFDNSGVGRVAKIPSVDAEVSPLVYETDETSRIFDGGIATSNSALNAPNRYIVVDTSNPDEPIVGYYDVPAIAPNSIASTGRVVAVVIDEQGLADVAAARERARRAALVDDTIYEWVSISTPPDPRHDTYNVVSIDGVRYREQGWTMRLGDGEEMTHELRRTYE